MKKYFAIFLVLCFCLAGTVIAAKDKVFIPHDIEIFYINEGSVETIYNLLWYSKDKKILDLKIPPEALNKEFLKILNRYIDEGGSVWVYNCDLAVFFGFKPDYLEEKEFKKKNKKEKFGTQDDYPVAVSLASPAGKSPILKNIKKIEVRILELYQGRYSAVKAEDGEDFIPLLKASTQEKLVCAAKKIGKGYVVFMPMINPRKYDGGRFLVNLTEFSAQFSLPEEVAENLFASVHFKNGQVTRCKILTKEINFETPENSEVIELKKIKEIKLSGGGKFDEVAFKDGNILKGFLYSSFIEIEDAGMQKTFRKEYIEKIIFE